MSKINDKVLSELLSRQLKKIDTAKKFEYSDIKRISKYLDKSIFNDECILWKGYITNYNNQSKGVYINFYFRKKKYALHRLLYSNYVGILFDDEYLKFTCPNRGMCCNINHLTKFKYNDEKEIKENDNIEEKIETNKKDNTNTNINDNNIETNFIIDFD
jgi:hypothetical protein